ncbi:MAG: excinuclease ABC subunit UvrA [Proteobacteria bacterium]|nr:excinuclease ABC subunit UvrA [Pseudomonadota bacterium]
MNFSDKIVIRGARQHNLKNIDLSFPRNKLVVITGLSGSGKSSLAFDTLYAEGQRRYVESLSTYARQFLGRMEKPDVDSIDGLSPAIAIEQKSVSHNPRSTVGTVTEIYDYLRLLYARVGTPHCHLCGTEILSQALDQIIDQVLTLPEGTRIIILSPIKANDIQDPEKHLKGLKKNGFTRLRQKDRMIEIDDIKDPDKLFKLPVDLIIDRLVVKDSIQNRLADSLELALAQSLGFAMVSILDHETHAPVRELSFSEKAACPDCGEPFPDLSPASFSFNSHQGACSACEGLGTTTDFDPDLLVPNPELSLREGAVVPWSNRESMQFFEFLDALTSHYQVNMNTPYKDLPDSFKALIMHGSGDEEIPFYFERDGRRVTYKKVYEGIITGLEKRLKEEAAARSRDDIRQFISFRPCPQCHGTRLNSAGRSVHVGGLTLPEFTALPISHAISFMQELHLSGKKLAISETILAEIKNRLSFLQNVGLKYLTLDRPAGTLSGGENQRIRLATQIGSKLSGVLYVLDEPSIGLHQRDNLRLLSTLKQIRDLGNTVLVVEHDEETILSSDYVIDMGPGAGVHGGEVIFSGKPDKLLVDERSLTGQYFSGRKKIHIPENRRPTDKGDITLYGARENNLKGIDVAFPTGCFTCVTGVSGSGKSSLILMTLYRVLAQHLYQAKITAGAHDRITGIERIDKVIDIDQSPIGKTPRSNPATYTGIFSFIRDLFSKTQDSRARGFKAGRFSFNVKGGRCEACTGDGIIKIEMHFLPDVYVPCDVCRGKRYNRETLEIRYKGKTIADVLDMTVNQALSFFAPISAIREKLETLKDVGMGYIHLGQPATTLSGGEAQRIKLAKELGKKDTGRTVYILDEPTTGLHTEDIRKLLSVLNRLVDAGNTVIVIEHNLDVIKCADHIIDIGPEGGDEGGYIVAMGAPETIIRCAASHTGHFLKHLFV